MRACVRVCARACMYVKYSILKVTEGVRES